jgi:membrane-associated phospholipid phosphatase
MKFILIMVILISLAHAEEKLAFKRVFTEIPKSSVKGLKRSFSKQSLPYWGAIAASTGALIYYDEKILAGVQKKGRDLRIGNHDGTKAAVSFGGQELVRLPSDTGSFLYFLGDGWMHTTIAASFLGAGALSENNRVYNTGIKIFHGMLVSTIFNQALKRSFGRESPEVKTHERGNWRPFPSFSEYNSKTASYDAMPTGHLMTVAMTFTVISNQFPEYRGYIYPLAGAWGTALGLQMINNGVHWASDYPLGIAMGIVFGKVASELGEEEKDPKKKEEEQTSWKLYPQFLGGSGIVAMKRF